ncbi:MAG: apolipoprotein N-acyltransferase [Variovorax sp.]
MRQSRRCMAAALAGLAQGWSIAWPWGGAPLWWLQGISLAALVWLLGSVRGGGESRPTLQGFWIGWAFAMAWLAATWWWLYISLHTYGGLAAPLTVIAILLLAAGLGLYYAVAAAAFVALPPSGWAWRALLFAAVWTLAELARNSWFTGFPWGAGGYAHVDGPLAMFAESVGVYGIGAIAAVAAVAAAQCTRLRYRRRGTWLAPLGLALCLGAAAGGTYCTVHGCDFQDTRGTRDTRDTQAIEGNQGMRGAQGTQATTQSVSAGRLRVALLQGNIPQNEKFVPGGGVATALDWYSRQLLTSTAALVVTPETALPLLPQNLPPGLLDTIAARYSSDSQAAIVGLPLGGGAARDYSNSVLGFRPGLAAPYRYDKHHLVPFGEFVPGMFRWFTDLMHIPLGDFRRGGLAQPSFEWRGQRIAPNICYEDLFGEEIGANFRDAATAPTILLNVSNIAWFGDSVAIDQHLAISRMRALEFKRPMARATNTGETVVIDHHGRVTAALPRLERGVLVADVEGRNGITLYAWWVSRFGLWPLWIVAIGTVVAAFIANYRRSAVAR